jgi:hypothetical protein
MSSTSNLFSQAVVKAVKILKSASDSLDTGSIAISELDKYLPDHKLSIQFIANKILKMSDNIDNSIIGDIESVLKDASKSGKIKHDDISSTKIIQKPASQFDKTPPTIQRNGRNVMESKMFSRNLPINTNGKIRPRKITGTVYHGSCVEYYSDWFIDLDPNFSDYGIVWVTSELEISKSFSNRFGGRNFFINRYKLKSARIAEVDMDAFHNLGGYDFEEIRMNLESKGYDGWLATGGIDDRIYEDIGIFDPSILMFDAVSFSYENKWTEFMGESEALEWIEKRKDGD